MHLEDNRPGYYAIIPAAVRYDERLPPNAKLLYGEISALAGKEGYCFATNSYFARLYGMSPENVARLLTKLEQAGHIRRRIRRDDRGQVVERRLYLTAPSLKIRGEGIDEIIRKNSTSKNKRVHEEEWL